MSEVLIEAACAALGDEESARPSAELLADEDAELGIAGLHAWWVDEKGAAELSRGLGPGLTIPAGIVFIGESGGTRHSGKTASGNTLRGRIKEFAGGKSGTLCTTLDAILHGALGPDSEVGTHLTQWMAAHLRVTTWATDDERQLEDIKNGVLGKHALPFDLQSPDNEFKARISELRTQRKREKQAKSAPPTAAE